jgi:hypothetical protein
MAGIGMELFQGFDTFGGKIKNTVVTGTSGTPAHAAESYYTVCTDLESVQKALKIDASVSGSYGAFSADAKAEYVHDLSLVTNSVVVVVYASNTTTTTMTNAELPEGTKLTNTAEVNKFVHKNGDCFASQITKGGEYYATFTFYSQTTDEKTAVQASLNLGVKGSLDASVSTQLSEAMSSAKVEYSMKSRLVGISGESGPSATGPSDVADIVNYAKDFKGKTMNSPETISFEVRNYEELLDPSVPFDGVTHNRQAFAGTAAEPGWGRVIARLTEVLNDCTAIKGLYDFYGGYKDKDLDSRANQVQTDLKGLFDLADKVRNNPTEVQPFTPPESYQWGIPEPEWILTSASDKNFLKWGAINYQDVSHDQIGQRVHLKQVQAWVGSENGYGVWRVRTTYSTQFPPGDFAIQRGGYGAGGGGSERLPLNLGDNEFVSSMAGWQGRYFSLAIVGALILKTSAGQTWQTDDAPTSGVQTWPDQGQPAKENQTVIGFVGSSGDVIDAIQPLAVEFRPVNWRHP